MEKAYAKGIDSSDLGFLVANVTYLRVHGAFILELLNYIYPMICLFQFQFTVSFIYCYADHGSEIRAEEST